jgi:pimeloyl-ACP methyl ester carboxylesterase
MPRLILGLIITGLIAAFGLGACAHRDIPWETLDERYSLPSSQFADFGDGFEVHYTDEGPRDAPVIVAIHGLAASVHAWRPWADRLTPDYRVIALDLPGHGLTRTPKGYRASLDTNVDTVERLARQLDLPPFVLAGNSMGGAVAWRYAMLHPDDLSGLVLVNAAGWPGDGARSGPPGGFGILNNPVGRAILKALDPRWVVAGVIRDSYLDPALSSDAVITRYVELLRAPRHRDVLLTQSSAPSTPVIPEDFARLTTPTLVIAGEKDAIIPVEQQRSFAGAIPGARLSVYPEGGHLVMEQLPDETVRDLRAFLGSLQPVSGQN